MQSNVAARGYCGEIVLMYSHCILLCVIPREESELLMLRVKLTILMKYGGTPQTFCCITVKCSHVTWAVILDVAILRHFMHTHLNTVCQASHYNVPQYLMIWGAAEWKPQSGQPDAEPASGIKRRRGRRGRRGEVGLYEGTGPHESYSYCCISSAYRVDIFHGVTTTKEINIWLKAGKTTCTQVKKTIVGWIFLTFQEPSS